MNAQHYSTLFYTDGEELAMWHIRANKDLGVSLTYHTFHVDSNIVILLSFKIPYNGDQKNWHLPCLSCVKADFHEANFVANSLQNRFEHAQFVF